jgi:hypothetical protein
MDTATTATEDARPSLPESHRRLRSIDPTTADIPMRLGIVRDALREGEWTGGARRSLAEALRAVVLELAELDDARMVASLYLDDVEKMSGTQAYLERAASYGRSLCDALVMTILDPRAEGSIQARIAQVLDAWEDEIPFEVVFEMSERGDVCLRRRIHALHAAWERSARGLVDRLIATSTWEAAAP